MEWCQCGAVGGISDTIQYIWVTSSSCTSCLYGRNSDSDSASPRPHHCSCPYRTGLRGDPYISRTRYCSGTRAVVPRGWYSYAYEYSGSGTVLEQWYSYFFVTLGKSETQWYSGGAYGTCAYRTSRAVVPVLGQWYGTREMVQYGTVIEQWYSSSGTVLGAVV